MKPKFMKLVPAAALAGVTMAVFVNKAVASSSAYAFTMNFRYVSGKDNKRLHTLDPGELTLSGRIWVHEKVAKAQSAPSPVTIDVVKDSFLKPVVCSLSVVPEVTLHSKRTYSRSCGRIEAGTYWIRVSKDKSQTADGDGWHSQGSGTLTTK